MNLSTKQKQTHRHREQTGGCQGGRVGKGWIGSLGLADLSYTMNKSWEFNLQKVKKLNN